MRTPRLPGQREPNALSLTLDRLRQEGREILDLTLSNPTACGLPLPDPALLSVLSDPAQFRYQPEAQGARVAREAIATHQGHGVQATEMVLCASTSEAYAWLFKLLAEAGDEILVPSPSYPLFEWLARLEGLRARSVPCFRHEGWCLDLLALEEACTPRTRMIVVVNPNNPTGQFLSRVEWTALTELCQRRGLALIVDEVFADFVLERPMDRLVTALEDAEPPCPVFVLAGLSKTCRLPQVKLAWILLRGAARELLDPLLFIADQFLSVSSSAQALGPVLLAQAADLQRPLLERLRHNLAQLDGALEAHPQLSRLPVEGGWSVILRRPAVDTDEACVLRILEETGVLVHPGHFFDFPDEGHLVLSLLPEPEAFRVGVQILLSRL